MDEPSNIVQFPGKGDPGKAPASSGMGSIDMRSDLVEEALKVVIEPPMLINMVSRRVKQLNLGRPPLVETDFRMGKADIALTEIIEGKVIAEDGDEE